MNANRTSEIFSRPGRVSGTCRLLVLLLLGARAVTAADSLLDLGSGDFLRGGMVAINPETLLWRHQLSGTELSFPLAKVQRVLLPIPREQSPSLGDTLLLDTGDILCGKLESLDESSARLTSATLGTLTLPRQRLRAARLAASDTPFTYNDSGDLKGWSADTESGIPTQWSSADKTLKFSGRASEILSREVAMPVAAAISFDFSWDKTQTPRPEQFSFGLCTTGASANQTTDHYLFTLTRSMLSGQRTKPVNGTEKSNSLGRVNIASFTANNLSLHLKIILDRPGHKLIIFVNDRQLATWDDPMDGWPTGSGIQFIGYPGMTARIRNLKIESWNGLMDNAPESLRASGTTDLLLAADDDEMFGHITGLRRNAAGEREIQIVLSVDKSKPAAFPVARIRQVIFANSAAPPPDAVPLVRLRDGSRLSGTALSSDNRQLAFTYFANPPVHVPLNQVLCIEFPAFAAATQAAAKEKKSKPEQEVFEE